MHSKYSIIVSNGWDNRLILYTSPFDIQAAMLSLIERYGVIKMYNHRFCEWNGSKWQVWNVYLEFFLTLGKRPDGNLSF